MIFSLSRYYFILIIMITTLLSELALGAEEATDHQSCIRCYQKQATQVHCASADFKQTACCRYSPITGQAMQSCMNKFKYCTKDLKYSAYKVYTCPPNKCPGGGHAQMYENTELNVKKSLSTEWEYWSRAYNCKFLISANAGLNGKMIVDVANVENANAYVFLQPNSFNTEISTTHGILENNMIYALT